MKLLGTLSVALVLVLTPSLSAQARQTPTSRERMG
jgi:hypothetical protein